MRIWICHFLCWGSSRGTSGRGGGVRSRETGPWAAWQQSTTERKQCDSWPRCISHCGSWLELGDARRTNCGNMLHLAFGLTCNPKGNWQIVDSSFWMPRLGSSPRVCVCVYTWLGPMCASEHMCTCSVHTYTSDRHIFCSWEASLVAEMVKNLPPMQETGVQSLGWEEPLEKEMAIHSSILAWRIPWTEEPGRLQSMRSKRLGHD